MGVDAGVTKASEFAREWDREEGTGDFSSFLGLSFSCDLSPPSVLSGDCIGELVLHIIIKGTESCFNPLKHRLLE